MEKIASNKFIAGGRSSTTKEAVDRLLDKVDRGARQQDMSTSNQLANAGSAFKVSVGRVEILKHPPRR